MFDSLLFGVLLTVFGPAVPAGLESAAATVRDTTFAVPAGALVRVHNADGDIGIRATSGRQGRAIREHDDEGGVQIRRRGDAIELGPAYGDGDLMIELPADVTIEVMGGDGDISIRGFSGTVLAETFDGDVAIDGGGAVSVHSVDGDVSISDVTSSVTVDMGDGDAHIRDVVGPITVNGIDGDVIVERADSRTVLLSTISGSLMYDGRVYEGGEYELATHDGDVTFAIAADVGARVSVFTYDGALIPSFPLQLRGAIGSVAEFTLGNGSARVKLESFDGNIHLIRPGERSPDN